MANPVISNGNPKFRSAPVVLASAMAVGANGAEPTNVTSSAPLPVNTTGNGLFTVAASQTDSMAGGTGAVGDYLHGVLIVPATTSPGAVSIEYGSTNIIIFAGGATSVADLKPFFVPIGAVTPSGGGWEITTGANVSAIAIGRFTA